MTTFFALIGLVTLLFLVALSFGEIEKPDKDEHNNFYAPYLRIED